MISVCIATHNGGAYLSQQISSILSQILPDDEIVISDDGSTDDSIKIIESFRDKRIKLVHYRQLSINGNRHKNFIYATRNFENALRYAKGDFIFLCDQDDIWYPNKIKICVSVLTKYDFVKHDYTLIDKNGKILELNHYNYKYYNKLTVIKALKDLPFRGCCMAFRKSVIDSCMPFPSKCFQHDSWIGINAILNRFKFKYINCPLIYHRVHDNNVSKLNSPNKLYYKLWYRIKLMYDTVKFHRAKI